MLLVITDQNTITAFCANNNQQFSLVTYSGGAFGGIRAAEALRVVTAELGAPAIPISVHGNVYCFTTRF